MLALLATLFPVLAIDVLNPVLFALMVYAAGSQRPVLNSTSLLLGHTLAYFFVGIGVALGLEQISERLNNPQSIDFAIGGVVGALLVWVSLAMRKSAGDDTPTPTKPLTPLRCLGIGALVNFIGSPFALPYFGAIDQILKADLGLGTALLVLGLYNLGYALVFAVVPASIALAGDAAKPMLERINRFLVGASDLVMPWLILALGAWLLFDATRYFVGGQAPAG